MPSPYLTLGSTPRSDPTLKIAWVMDLEKSHDVTSSSQCKHPLQRFVSHRPSECKDLILAKMPRSATDATRFTSTTPHASAKPPPKKAANAIPPRTPGPPGETPQEKVRRLRAAADRARDAQVSNFDKVILRGRVWADRLHRFTALSLIGITGMISLIYFMPSRYLVCSRYGRS